MFFFIEINILPGVENAYTLRWGYLGLNFNATNTATPAPRLCPENIDYKYNIYILIIL